MVRAGIIHVSFARVKVVISEKASVENTFVKVCIARYKVLPPLILIITKRPSPVSRSRDYQIYSIAFA